MKYHAYSARGLLRTMCFMMLSCDGHSGIWWQKSCVNDPGPRLGKDLQALSIRRPFHMPSSVKSSDALRNGAQPCSGVLLPMSNLFAEICRAFIYLVRQCATLLSLKAARIKFHVKLPRTSTSSPSGTSTVGLIQSRILIANFPGNDFVKPGLARTWQYLAHISTVGFNMLQHVSNEVNSYRLCIMHLRHQALGRAFDRLTLPDFARMQLRYYLRARLVTLYCMTTQCNHHTVNESM